MLQYFRHFVLLKYEILQTSTFTLCIADALQFIFQELFLYKRDLLDRDMVIALNKIDTDANGELAEHIQHQLANISKG